MDFAEATGLAGAACAALVVPAAVMQWRASTRARHEALFKAAIHDTGEDQPWTAKEALEATNPEWRSPSIPMLAKSGWILDSPQPLDRIHIELRPATGDEQLERAKRRAARLLPRSFSSYSKTVVETIPGMGSLFNGVTYRPIHVQPTVHGLNLIFTEGLYFDNLDTTEVLAYEAELTRQSRRPRRVRSYRDWLADPFDLQKRSTSLGIITLTIRRDGRESGFYMHRRSRNTVLLGPNLVHAVPAGEFTPSDVSYESRTADFDLWRNVMREYAEEFLDAPEAYGDGGTTIDFERDTPYRQLNQGLRDGDLHIYSFGLALDPLTWKPELLTVCILEARLFDSVFKSIVEKGREGTIISGPHGKGIPLTEASVEIYATEGHTRFAAVSCLKLTWQHRAALGVVPG